MVSLQAAIAAIALSGIGQTGQTVLLDFYTDWCAPCRAMSPTIQGLVAAGYPVQRVNKDQNPALAAKFNVQSIPCFVMVVDGREADRVVGTTTYSRLERMCKMGAAASGPPAMLAQNTPSPFPPTTPPSPAPSASVDWRGGPPATNQLISQPASAAAGVSDAALLAASVRLRVDDPGGRSCGSGTIVDARDGQALILTCGHIFRDSHGNGPITVDLFGPNGPQQVPGTLRCYDADKRDIGLVLISTPGPVATARVAPPGYRIDRGMPVVSVGCNNGDPPTVRHSQVSSLNKFAGEPNIEVAGQPVEGRSGGGLFSSEGYLIGVCNAADPSDREGLFAALESICAELDRAQLAFVYKSPSGNQLAAPQAASAAALAANPLPTMPREMPGPADLASFSAPPAAATDAPSALPAHERAALDEIHQSIREGAEVVCIIRPRGDSTAKSEVIMLDHASPELVRQLSAEGRRSDRPYPTSLELPKVESPKPRNVLLEWSAGNGKAEGGTSGR
jgi:thiol-disulfide isomerase/thioredoxin